MTTDDAIETLAKWSGKGNYDVRRQSRLVRRGDVCYLIHDVWSGRDHLEGETYRPHVYVIPSDLAARAADLIANGDDSAYDAEYRGYASKIQELEHEILTDDRVQYFGDQLARAWAADL